MTKQYPIVHLNNEMYMIDKGKSKANAWTWFFDHKDYAQIAVDCEDSEIGQILAATDKELGLPLLPAIENNVEQQALQYFAKLHPQWKKDAIIHSESFKKFLLGYKAASTKKWSDEDMRKAFMQIPNAGGEFIGKQIEQNFQDFLQSLQPKPIAVEVVVEVECYCGHTITCDCGQEPGKPYVLIPEVDANNTIIVKRYFYEE